VVRGGCNDRWTSGSHRRNPNRINISVDLSQLREFIEVGKIEI